MPNAETQKLREAADAINKQIADWYYEDCDMETLEKMRLEDLAAIRKGLEYVKQECEEEKRHREERLEFLMAFTAGAGACAALIYFIVSIVRAVGG